MRSARRQVSEFLSGLVLLFAPSVALGACGGLSADDKASLLGELDQATAKSEALDAARKAGLVTHLGQSAVEARGCTEQVLED